MEINFDEIVSPKFDSKSWFHNKEPVIIVKNNKKYGILMNPSELYDTANKAYCTYDAILVKEVEGKVYTLVKENEKWGLVDWFENIT